jgi:hypothetical protein
MQLQMIRVSDEKGKTTGKKEQGNNVISPELFKEPCICTGGSYLIWLSGRATWSFHPTRPDFRLSFPMHFCIPAATIEALESSARLQSFPRILGRSPQQFQGA